MNKLVIPGLMLLLFCYASAQTSPQSGGHYTIKSITESKTPKNVKRTKLGVAERVTLSIDPEPESEVTWTIEGDGEIIPKKGDKITFTAASFASNPTIIATIGNENPSINFKVIEPSKESGVLWRKYTFSNGVSGSGMYITVTDNPTEVSFYRIEILEEKGPASNVTGYMLGLQKLGHDLSHDPKKLGYLYPKQIKLRIWRLMVSFLISRYPGRKENLTGLYQLNGEL
jgi:hypothetical protein